MCFKKPKPPTKSAEDKARERELEEQLLARKRELAATRSEDKKERTEESIARMMGAWGLRSLIAGPKGGSGFSRDFRKVSLIGGGSRSPSPSPTPSPSSGGGGSGYSDRAPHWKLPGGGLGI